MDKVSFGYETSARREDAARRRRLLQRGRRYDLMNDLMSGGMHRLWKDQFVRG
jgi:demethylmenaquinone methyltransferase/2-methoxy-6-polyprenyl-1,4-benzoquinol methylase